MSSKSREKNMSSKSREKNMSSKSREKNTSSKQGTRSREDPFRVKKNSQDNGYRESSSGLLLQATSIISGTSKETDQDLKVAKRLRDGASSRKISCHQNHQREKKKSSVLLCPSYWFVRRREREPDQKKDIASGQYGSCEDIDCGHGTGCGEGMGCGHGARCGEGMGCGHGAGCGEGMGCGHLTGCGHWTGRCMWRLCFLCFCLPVCYPCFLSRTLRKLLKQSPNHSPSPPLRPDPLKSGNKDIIKSSLMSRRTKVKPSSERGVFESPEELNVIFLQTEQNWEIVGLLNKHHRGMERKNRQSSPVKNSPGTSEEKMAGEFDTTALKKFTEVENGTTAALSGVISDGTQDTIEDSDIETKGNYKPLNDLETISEEVSMEMNEEVIPRQQSLRSSLSDVFYSLEGSQGSGEGGQETLLGGTFVSVSESHSASGEGGSETLLGGTFVSVSESHSASLKDYEFSFDTSNRTLSSNIYEKSSNPTNASQKSVDQNKDLLSLNICAKLSVSPEHREEFHSKTSETKDHDVLVDIDKEVTSSDKNISETNEECRLPDISYFLFDHLVTLDNHWSAKLSLSAELPLGDWNLQNLSSTCFSSTDILVAVYREENQLNSLLEMKTGMLGYSRQYWTGFFPLLLVQLVGDEKVGPLSHGVIGQLCDQFSAIHRIMIHPERPSEASFLLNSLLKFQVHVQQCVKMEMGSREGRKGGVESKFMSLLCSNWECSGPCQLSMVSPLSGGNVGNRLRRKKFFQSVRKQMTIRRKKGRRTEQK